VPAPSPRPPCDAAATRQWAERLDRFRSGHRTVAAFCAAEGVSPSNFYLWRRRLAQPARPPTAKAPAVVPLRISPPFSPPIELILPSGAIVRLPADARPELIVAILRGVEARQC
jgi:transposase